MARAVRDRAAQMKAGGQTLSSKEAFSEWGRAQQRARDPRVLRWQAQIDSLEQPGSQQELVETLESAFSMSTLMRTPENYVKLVSAYVRTGDTFSANDALRKGLDKFPASSTLLQLAAEYSMAERRYTESLDYWDRSLRQQDTPIIRDGVVSRFPLRGLVFDWYEIGWIRIAEDWPSLWDNLGRAPSAGVYQKTIQTLVAATEYGLAKSLSLRALSEHPDHRDLSIQASETLVRHSPGEGSAALIRKLRSSHSNTQANLVATRLKRAQAIEADLQGLGPAAPDELRILTAYRHTGADYLVRSGAYWDEGRIHLEAMRLAKRDRWPEQHSETDRVSELAWRESVRFAETRAAAVGVNPGALARAVFHYFKQELTQKLPVDRIAQNIAANSPEGKPIYVDLGAAKIGYMVSYPTSRMQNLYFYDALRSLGMNVFLVRFPRRPVETLKEQMKSPSVVSMPRISLVPQIAQLKPPKRPIVPSVSNSGHLVVPSGIRSVRKLTERLSSPLVVNSGSAVKGFAYDQSIHQAWDYDVNLNFHATDKDLLPTFNLATQHGRTWRRTASTVYGNNLRPSVREPVEAFLSSGEWVVGDWHEWMERPVVPYFRDFVKRTRRALAQNAVMDVHVGDYLYAEPALIAAKVKDRGGRVHIWPHSSNPVHVEFQDPSQITSVRAITRSGSQVWKDALPEAEVVHDAGLMLDPPFASTAWQDGEPLSLVVIGGRSVMRNLPILDIEAHEKLYQRYFRALAPLVDSGKLKIYFKPRGTTGEHETWLERLVGRTGNWERVLEHPMRLELPNPVFASLTVGSSALLEGVSRGIPGFIVRDEGYARDYLATEAGVFETLSSDGAASKLEDLTTASSWDLARHDQMERLNRELE